MAKAELGTVGAGVAVERSGGARTIVGLVRSARPKQWTKNLLLFFGLIFAMKLGEPALLVRAAIAFAAFCAASSAVYLVNDLADVEQDRRHPRKRKRPLASGQVPPGQVRAFAGVLVVAALAASVSLGPAFAALTVAYLALQVLYSFRLKHVVLVDVVVLASGFVLRAAAGAVAVEVPISPWLYVCTLLAALFLALAKRRHELVLLDREAGDHRRILLEYSVPLLDQLIVIVTATTLMAYSLYTFSAENLPADHSMMLTIPFVLFGIFRYLYLVHIRDGGGTPDESLLADYPLLVSAALWLATATAILYVLPHK